MKLLSLFLFSLFFLPSATWETDFDKAKNEANQNKKLILLHFCGSDWNSAGQKMKKELFDTAPFETFANEHLVLVCADFPKQEKNKPDKETQRQNERLWKKFNPLGHTPFTVLVAPNTEKVMKVWDLLPKTTPENFVLQLREGIDIHK